MSAGLLHFNPLLNHARMCEIWSNRPWTHTRDPVTLAGKFAQSFPGTQWSLVNASLTWNCLKGVYLKRNFKWVRGGEGGGQVNIAPFPTLWLCFHFPCLRPNACFLVFSMVMGSLRWSIVLTPLVWPLTVRSTDSTPEKTGKGCISISWTGVLSEL